MISLEIKDRLRPVMVAMKATGPSKGVMRAMAGTDCGAWSVR